MLRVVYSNRTEELIRELAARVRAQQGVSALAGQAPGGLGPLVPVPVVVPGAAMESALRLGIAREVGIAANLDVQLLTRFAANVAGVRVADAGAIEAMVLELLLGDMADAALAPLRAYLHSAGDDADAVDGRRAQLAARIGRIFEEYTYSRAEMLSGWLRSDEPQVDARHAELEAWQRRLWRLLFGPQGLATWRSPRIVPLHEAVAAFEPRADAPPAHLFGFAHVARTFHALLERLGRVADVTVYTLSPCEGFWEDVNERDPAPLHLWSRPGRDNVRALNAAAGFDHEERFVDPLDARDGGRGRTLLRQIQSDVMRREPVRSQPGPGLPGSAPEARFALEGDRSLEVHGHASVRRECEAVAADVWRRLRVDASLRFDDVAVLVPAGDAPAYVAHMTAAMREAHDLPHQVVGAGEGAPGRILEAIELLLALPLGRFTRPELLRLLVHPAVVASAARADGGALDPERWVAWCDALGIVHGADRDDHAATYIERDILNWDQGLRRLALGAFMAGDASGAGEPVRAPDVDGVRESYVPLEVAGTELHDAATFGLLVRSLVADARFARESVLAPREWAALLRAMIETYVAPTTDAEGDELSRRLRQVGSLADVDLGDARVSYRIATELVRERLGRGAGAGNAARGGEGGVVLSTLGHLRGIPYRVVYACGMGEGRFPSSDAEDPLDLRWARRRDDSASSKRAESSTRPGDVTARDRDKYAFLETLLGARDALVLSHVSRDPLTGDALAPSSVVQELLHAVSLGYVKDPVAAGIRVVHPLRRWDDAATVAELPEAGAEARTVAVRRSAERHAGSAGGRPTRGEILAHADAGDPAWRALAEHLGLARLPEVAAAVDGRVTVPMYAIVKFLEMPLQGWASFRLGLDETESEDLAARESEPFETDPRDETLILRDVMLAAAQTGCSLEEAYDSAVRDRELRGLGPSGVFARGERADALRALETWKRELEQRGVGLGSLVMHRFGRAGEHARPARAHEAVVIEVDVPDASGKVHHVRAEIQGRTLPVGARADGAVSVTLAKRANEAPKEEWARAGRKRSTLRSFVDHAVLAASGEPLGPCDGLVVVASQDGPVPQEMHFRPLTPDAAKSWLRGVVRELLGAPHAYFLPCEAVFVRSEREGEPPATAIVEEARDKLRGGDGPPALRSAYGPVPRPQEYPIPDEATAREMIERRFGPLLPGDQEDEP
jgi:exodeoxyribonuclease V gamma subunit